MESPLHELAEILAYVNRRISGLNIKDEEIEFKLRHQNVRLLNVMLEIKNTADLIEIDKQENK